MQITNSNRKITFTLIWNFIKSREFLSFLICFVFSLLIAAIFSLSITPVKYSLKVGMVPKQTITAPRDVIDRATTEQFRQSAANAVTPTFKYNEYVQEEVLSEIKKLSSEISDIIQYAKTLSDYSSTKKYSKQEIAYASSILKTIKLTDNQIKTILESDEKEVNTLLKNLYSAVKNTLESNVSQGQEGAAISSITQVIGYQTDFNLLQNVVVPILKQVIKPNMLIDIEATEKAKQEAMSSVESIILKQGQNIIVKGEGRITEAQLQILDDLGLLAGNQKNFSSQYGSLILSFVALVLYTLALYTFTPKVFDRYRQLFIIYITILITILISWLAKTLGSIYASPIILASLLISSTLGMRPAIITNTFLALMIPFLLVVGGNSQNQDIIFIMLSSILSGSFVAIFINKNSHRGSTIIAGFIASVSSIISMFGIGLILGADIYLILNNSLLTAAGIMVSGLLTLALQPMFESFFNISSDARLLDLSSPMHPLLRRLQMEAPGTYHHSVIIANLAEASAHAIGANELIARVGGYYHDIGKLKRPLYFKENQIGQNNPHDKLTPIESASIISSHTRDGLALAKQYRLPVDIQDIVLNHHGNSLVKYFYFKAKENETSENPINEDQFRYDGQPPVSKEASIVMICDTLEAAVRTLNSPNKEEIKAFIKKLIEDKVAENQFINSKLSFADLEKIANACANILFGVFHERIEYPSQKKLYPKKPLKLN